MLSIRLAADKVAPDGVPACAAPSISLSWGPVPLQVRPEHRKSEMVIQDYRAK